MTLSYSNSDSLPPVQENEFLPPLGRWTTVGGMVMLSFIGIAIATASVAKYKVTVKAQANLRPAGELRIVQAATEGSVMRVSVKENQVVKKGDIIATIDDSRLQTKKSQLQSNIQQSQLQFVQINAQISALNSQIRAETDRINRVIAGASAELEHRSRDYRDKQIITTADVEEAEANVKIAHKELQKATAELKSAEADLKSRVAGLSAAQSKRNRYQKIAKVGALSQDQFEEAQLVASQQEQAVEAQKAVIQAQKQTIERLQQAISAASARGRRAVATLNPSKAEVAIALERIAQEKASLKANQATLDKERKALIQQRIGIQQTIERDSRELKQVEIDLSQTVITATADGIISKLNLRNSGQTVRPGEEIAQIVPSDAPLVVKAVVASEEKSKLKEGQNVLVRVSACPYPDYGTLKGKVKAISPDAFIPQANGAAGVASTTVASQKAAVVGAFYEVTIEPESLFLYNGKKQCSIQLGMEGRADIISREETVLQFFLRKARLIADF
ncbi:HlyD family efflux transporter periplasmic adaptor subunit [Iningainema tapete]|uniref:HlyD family efflux transporter periplasmic adaptor subunit n=1 Tax=Iningainema tapete BLCC-T55 TaxID=2748662 RepID=A0A8J6XTH5_9CYAN|nr:HlyD family efflux transporter periplasmic adaptor subunit [Iningainema tapete]MBD2778931.1 HlyD family efflux transporter periplasmic adaptor subunit [Iningainema tapete BLCC-T55]